MVDPREIDLMALMPCVLENSPAVDYFGDGSFLPLDGPGHAIGHLCGLARTTVDPPTVMM